MEFSVCQIRRKISSLCTGYLGTLFLAPEATLSTYHLVNQDTGTNTLHKITQ